MSEAHSTKPACTFDGCDRPQAARGLCIAHYKQSWKGRPLSPLGVSKEIARVCPVCEKPFVTLPFRTRTGRGVFCSKPCSTASLTVPLEVRFWRFVNKTETCWLWTGAHGKYGLINEHASTRTLLAHRVSWELANGPIPDDLFVLHRCDVPLCVRVDHLWLGTAKDNSHDMVAKGRSPRNFGETNGSAKMAWEKVRALRARHAQGGVSFAVLAEEFGIHTMTAFSIVKNKTWKE